MSPLADRIQADLVAALKARDDVKLSVLRMLKSSIQVAETEKGRQGELSCDDIQVLIRRALKQREEAAEMYRAGSADERAEAELQEARVLMAYLPMQLDDDALSALIREIIESTGASEMKDLGKVMGAAVKAVAGRADGKKIKEAAAKLLQN